MDYDKSKHGFSPKQFHSVVGGKRFLSCFWAKRVESRARMKLISELIRGYKRRGGEILCIDHFGALAQVLVQVLAHVAAEVLDAVWAAGTEVFGVRQ